MTTNQKSTKRSASKQRRSTLNGDVEVAARVVVQANEVYTINRHKLPDGATLITVFVKKARSS